MHQYSFNLTFQPYKIILFILTTQFILDVHSHITNTSIIYTSVHDIRYIDASVENSVPKIVISNLTDATIIDYYNVDDWIFFVDAQKKSVYRVRSMGDTRPTVVTDKHVNPTSLSIDRASRRLYVCDAGAHKIEVTDFQGTSRATVYKSTEFAPISVHMRTDLRRLFWTSSSSSRGRLESSSPCGRYRRLLISENIRTPHSLTSDQERLYWFDGFEVQLNSALLSGMQRSRLWHDAGTRPFSLHYRHGSLYWISARTVNTLDIEHSHLTSLQSARDYPSGLTVPSGIPSPPLDDPCSHSTCPELCVTSSAQKRGYACLCSEGRTSVEDAGLFRCRPASNQILLVAAGWNILGVTVATTSNSSNHIVEDMLELPIKGIKKAISVAYDYENSMVG